MSARELHAPQSSTRLIACVIAAELCSMAGFSTFAATLTDFSALWGLDSAAAGWISGAYNVGYVLAVPVLVGLTDRIDARRIYMAASIIGLGAGAGFALFASGFWSALLFRAMAGIALAGTYMPGLQLLNERLPARLRLRVVPYYTATFGIGVSLSFLLSGSLVAAFGWRIAFAAGAFGSVLAIGLVGFGTAGMGSMGVAPPASAPPAPTRHPLDLRPPFRNRDALVYIAGYFGHCWELFAFRAWLAAFLVYLIGRNLGGSATSVANHWATWIVLIGVPASIVGAEVASRGARLRLVRVVALASVVAGVACGLASAQPFAFALVLLFAYNFLIAADSGALTTGAVAESREGERGATLAVHTILGFIGGALGPLAVGFALDRMGGITNARAWTWAFAVMAAGSMMAALASLLFAPRNHAARAETKPRG
ncbi:MAG: MFS transporter [Burkholderiaceae bacterium]